MNPSIDAWIPALKLPCSYDAWFMQLWWIPYIIASYYREALQLQYSCPSYLDTPPYLSLSRIVPYTFTALPFPSGEPLPSALEAEGWLTARMTTRLQRRGVIRSSVCHLLLLRRRFHQECTLRSVGCSAYVYHPLLHRTNDSPVEGSTCPISECEGLCLPSFRESRSEHVCYIRCSVMVGG